MTVNFKHPRAKPRWLALFGLVAALSALTITAVFASHGGAANGIPSNYVFIVPDQQGANDVPGQVDLTQMARDDTSAGTYKLFWSWDSISAWTGTGQTGDACALFDNDGNTFIDFVVCVRVENNDANPDDVRIVSAAEGGGVFAFSCSDKKNDRCTNPVPVSFAASQVQAGALGTSPLTNSNLITHTDPFAAGESNPHDTTVEIHIQSSFIPLTEVLVNVCSYPSAGNGGNNNPFDCIVNPGGGFLVIAKNAGQGVTSPNFTFDIHTVQGGTPTFVDNRTIAGTGSAAAEPILVGSSVRVTETNINSAWELTAISCTLAGGGSTGTASLTNSWITGVQIQSGLVTTCTFTDRLRTGTLVVIKTVVNDDGGSATAGQFTYTLGDGSSATNETGTVSPGQSYTRNDGTTYNVQENAGGPAGYAVTYSTDCTGTVVANTTKTCTITNNDIAPTLALNKTVVNDNGGNALENDFVLSATPTTGSAITDAGGDVPATTAVANAQYTLSETTVTGYTAGAWACTGTGVTQGTGADANKVTLALGATGSCSITNNDVAPTLALNKTVVNDNGGNALENDFVLSATPTTGTAITDAGGDVPATNAVANVQYTLSETTLTGYTASAWTCSGTGVTQGTGADTNKVTLDEGATGSCSITNNDVAPTLALNKTVVNDNGGTAVENNFVLSATPTTGTAITDAGGDVPATNAVANVQYTLSETSPGGYTASAWTCSGSGVTQGTGADTNKVTLDEGAVGSCSITNDDTKAAPAGTTVQSWVLHDTLTITGIRAGAPDAGSANVVFRVYSNATCTTLVGSETDSSISAGGSASTTTGISVTASGNYYWRAQYSGDQFNEGFTTVCGTERTEIKAKDQGRDDFATP